MDLTIDDYKNILDFYNIQKPRSRRILIQKAEDILAKKLCKCIKKVKKKNNDTDETRAIGICKSAVLNRKKLFIYRFSCKPPKLKRGKTRNRKLFKNRTVRRRNN
jgi:hypothetical protein